MSKFHNLCVALRETGTVPPTKKYGAEETVWMHIMQRRLGYSIQERMLHHGTLSRADCWSWQIFGTSIGG